MIAGLQFTYLYHDFDIIEVRIFAQNGRFRGSADVYVGTNQLLEAAALLSGFPKNPHDKREFIFGAFGPKFAGGGVRLELFCKDLAGHPVIRATIETDSQQISTVDNQADEDAESATIYLKFEPAALDRFLAELREIEQKHFGSAILETDGA
jgi:hypothetical protein